MNSPSTIRLQDLWPPPDRAPDSGPGAELEILRRAIEIFGRRGYGGTSTRSIAAAASVTAPLIGYHFGSKEGLFRRCVDVVMGGVVEEVLGVLEEDTDLESMVHRYAALHVEAARSYPDALRFVLAVAYGPEEGQPDIDFFAYWNPVMQRMLERWQQAIDRGEFVPRPGTTPARLVQQLLNAVHLEVFAVHERERFGKSTDSMHEIAAPMPDPAGEVVAQFFQGAGTLTRRPGNGQEAP